jgi:hypothetical protein
MQVELEEEEIMFDVKMLEVMDPCFLSKSIQNPHRDSLLQFLLLQIEHTILIATNRAKM